MGMDNQQNQGGMDQVGKANQAGMNQAGMGQQGMDAQGMADRSMGDQDWSDQIQEHMEVVDAQGQHLGTVDSCDGDQIKLTKSDSTQHEHRFVPTSQIAGIDGNKIKLSSGGAAMPN